MLNHNWNRKKIPNTATLFTRSCCILWQQIGLSYSCSLNPLELIVVNESHEPQICKKTKKIHCRRTGCFLSADLYVQQTCFLHLFSSVWGFIGTLLITSSHCVLFLCSGLMMVPNWSPSCYFSMHTIPMVTAVDGNTFICIFSFFLCHISGN